MEQSSGVQLNAVSRALQEHRLKDARALARRLLREVSSDPALEELRFKLVQLCLDIDTQLLADYEVVQDDLLTRLADMQRIHGDTADMEALSQARKKIRD